MNGAERLAEAFADQAARWALRIHGDPHRSEWARQLALRVSLGLSAGHTCVALDTQTAGQVPEGVLAAALATGIVGTAAAPGSHPLICDTQGHLYLHRYFDYERRLAAALSRISGIDDEDLPVAVEAMLRRLFQGNQVGPDGIDWQQVAVAQALQQRLTLLCGGPGTGKTSTLVRLLGCLLTLSPQARIVLAAPTGKAAARMQEALRARSGELPPAVQAALPTSASTVHRLLAYDGRQRRYRHGREHRLMLDVLIVDEASMLDLALATQLCEAMPDGARLVLMGDRDQLAAVESGAVFAELTSRSGLDPAACARVAAATALPVARLHASQSAERRPALLPGSVALLRHSFRFASDAPVARFAAAVREGRGEEAMALLAAGSADLQWDASGVADGAAGPGLEATLAAAYAPYVEALQAQASTLEVFAAFDRFRILCAVRQGPWGAARLAEAVSRLLRARIDAPVDPTLDSPWYRGRPVMVLGNDPVLGVFNGDTGIALPNTDGELQVCFLRAGETLQWLDPVRLPPCETAFATTVHKSQGSEFDCVAILLPDRVGGLLTRELLYTAVTRARAGIRLIAADASVRAAIATPTERQSGLLVRLTEHLAEAEMRGADPPAPQT